MRLHYSKDVDVLYIRLKETDIEDTDEINEDFILDYDNNNDIVGIEILSISKKADIQNLVIQSFDKVMVETVYSKE